MNPEKPTIAPLMASHPCSLCRELIYGPHYRVYPKPLGSGCDLVCLGCAPTRKRTRTEEWFEWPHVTTNGNTAYDSVRRWVRARNGEAA